MIGIRWPKLFSYTFNDDTAVLLLAVGILALALIATAMLMRGRLGAVAYLPADQSASKSNEICRW